jgi:hypothetical protein
MSTPAEQVAATAQVAVENVVAEADAAIAAANERAAAAAQVAALVSEAAVQREITDEVDQLQEEVERWQGECERLDRELAAVRQAMTELQTTLPTLVTLEILTSELAKVSAQQSTPRQSPQPETPEERGTTNPSDDVGAPREAPLAEKRNRFRLT